MLGGMEQVVWEGRGVAVALERIEWSVECMADRPAPTDTTLRL